MIPRILVGLALCAAIPSPASAQTPSSWKSFKIGTLASFSNPFTVRPDGRFLYAEGGNVYSQNSFGSAAKTLINKGALTFDPSFLAVRSDTEAMLGIGGFGGPSGLHRFDPASPSTAISSTALATLQNYNAVWWQHPTSGRSGWIIGGINSIDSKNNLSFVSADGVSTGALTAALSTYSGGLATDALGNVYVGLTELFNSPDAAESEKVLKFTASQIDAAVAGVITSTPATLTKGEATVVFKAISAGSLAVDELGRIWAAGYLNANLELYDPGLARSYPITPKIPVLAGAGGAPVYQVATFTRTGTTYIAALANDGAFEADSDIAYAYAPAADFPVRTINPTSLTEAFVEADAVVSVPFSISPAPNRSITVPLAFSGVAKRNVDFTAPSTITFTAGQITASLPVTLKNNSIDSPVDKTFTITLGTATPAGFALVDPQQKSVVVTILDDDERPVVQPTQNFALLQVGAAFTHTLQMTGEPGTKFTATGLPKGLSIDAKTGVISGTPTIPGEYAQVVITASSPAGSSTSVAFVMAVADFPAAAKGQFIALSSRTAGSAQVGARVDFTVSSTASYTGSVVIGTKKYPIKGVLNTTPTDPTLTSNFVHNGVAQTINITIDTNLARVSGTVLDGAILSGYQVLLSSEREGQIHFGIAAGTGPTVPEGHGFGSLKVSNLGKVAITGRTADNTAFTGNSCVSNTGDIILYHPLYRVTGSLAGSLVIDAHPDRFITGDLTWFKPTQRSGLYATGFPSTTLSAFGERYRPVAGSTLFLDTEEASLELGSLFLGDVTFSPPAKVSISAPHRISINNATGAITGTVRLGSESLPFIGLIIPNGGPFGFYDGRGLGFFTRASNGTIGALKLTAVP